MHALIFEQSGGELRSFPVPGESFARVLPKLKDAILEAQAVQGDRGNIQVGLAGLLTDLQSVSALMFARRAQTSRLRHVRSPTRRAWHAVPKLDPIYCAIADYHGSWDGPDAWFADAFPETMKKANASNFEMPKDG